MRCRAWGQSEGEGRGGVRIKKYESVDVWKYVWWNRDLKVTLTLQKCLTTLDLTSLGVGSCVGTGMYLVAGMVAHNVAGPGVVISFIIAAVASIFSGQ